MHHPADQLINWPVWAAVTKSANSDDSAVVWEPGRVSPINSHYQPGQVWTFSCHLNLIYCKPTHWSSLCCFTSHSGLCLTNDESKRWKDSGRSRKGVRRNWTNGSFSVQCRNQTTLLVTWGLFVYFLYFVLPEYCYIKYTTDLLG